ncbi:Uncharacterised protein [Vibrio cholerae]|nr:Uncharacterised protein [Vibrio cholerae]
MALIKCSAIKRILSAKSKSFVFQSTFLPIWSCVSSSISSCTAWFFCTAVSVAVIDLNDADLNLVVLNSTARVVTNVP